MSSFRLAFLFLAFHLFTPPILGQKDQNLSACKSVEALVSYCNSATPGWSSFTAFSLQAPCLCYESGEWKPQIYDRIASSCLDYYSTEDPAYLSRASASRGRGLPTSPCSVAGDLLAGTTISSSASTPLITKGPSEALSRYDINLVACNSIDTLASLCENYSPGFVSFSSSQQANCLCYSGRAWDPDFYDSLYGSCIDYISTANTSIYSSLDALGIISTPCKSIGDALAYTTKDLSGKMNSTTSRPSGSSISNGPSRTTPASVEITSTISPTTTKVGGSSADSSTQSATRSGVGAGIEVGAYNFCRPFRIVNTNTLISSVNSASSQVSCQQV